MDLKLLIEQTQPESSSYIGLQIQKKAIGWRDEYIYQKYNL